MKIKFFTTRPLQTQEPIVQGLIQSVTPLNNPASLATQRYL